MPNNDPNDYVFDWSSYTLPKGRPTPKAPQNQPKERDEIMERKPFGQVLFYAESLHDLLPFRKSIDAPTTSFRLARIKARLPQLSPELSLLLILTVVLAGIFGGHSGYSLGAAVLLFNPTARATFNMVGWVPVRFYGALGDGTNNDGPLIQQVLDKLNKWNGATFDAGVRGGTCVLNYGTYKSLQSLYTDARIKFMGQSGQPAGGAASTIKADPTGTYTNGPQSAKWLVKVKPDSLATAGYWWHGGRLVDICLDCQQVAGLGGFWVTGAGENSLIDNVKVTGTGVTSRTVTDVVTTSGSSTVTSATVAFTQDDVGGVVSDPSGYPNWSTYVPSTDDYTRTDAVFVKNSDIVTCAGAAFTSVHLHREILGLPFYVKTVVDGQHIQLNVPVTFTQGAHSITLTRPRTQRIKTVIDANNAILDRPATSSTTGGTMTIKRPRPGMQLESFSATGRIGSVNATNCSGAAIEFKNMGAPITVDSLAGDDNAFMVRVRESATSGDVALLNINSLKGESNQYGADPYPGGANSGLDLYGKPVYDAYGNHNTLILIDNCGMVMVNISSLRASSSERGSREVVCIDQPPSFLSGMPSVCMNAAEGSNPYNPQYEWMIRDNSTGRGVRTLPAPTVSATNGGSDALYYRRIEWNRPDPEHGSAWWENRRPGSESQHRSIEFGPIPPWAVGAPGWAGTIDTTCPNNGYSYNFNHHQNDELGWFIDLSRGSWQLWHQGKKGPDRAIITWDISFDGGVTWTALGTIDQYNATASGISTFTSSSFLVGQAGRAIVRARGLTRNASATDWFMSFAVAALTKQP